MEAMRFGGVIQRILGEILTANPCLEPVYISKVDLADAYMILWVIMEDILSFAILISKKTPSYPQLVGFHLSITMGYVYSAPYFFMETDMVADLANKAIAE